MAGTEETLIPGGQSGDQTPNDPNTVTVTGYQDKGDTGRTGISNPPDDPIETSQPTPQTQAPQTPQVAPDAPQQPQPAPPGSMQEPAPVKAPYFPTGEPTDPNANNPLVKLGGVMHSVVNAILPPTFTTTVDPNTGITTRKQVPRTKTDIGMAIALEAISGGLAGLSAQGPSNLGKAGLLGLQQGQAIAQKQQELQQQQDKQAGEDFTRQANEKTRQAAVLDTNMRMYSNAQSIGRADLATNQSYVKPFRDAADKIDQAVPGSIKAIIPESEFAKYHVTKDNAIPYEAVPRPDPTQPNGQAVNQYGVPQWDINYAIIDPAMKMDNLLSPDEMKTLQDFKVAGTVNGDGDAIKWPVNAQLSVNQWLNKKSMAASLTNSISEFQNYADTLNTNSHGYKFTGGGNVDVPNDAGQADQIDAAVGKYTNVPKAVLRSVAMQESGGHHIDPKTGKIAASGTGPTGIMQIAKSTASQYKGDASDQASNIDMSAHYLSDLIDQNHGDLKAALQTYGGNTPGYAAQVLKRAGMDNATGTQTTAVTPVDLKAEAAKDHNLPKVLDKWQAYVNGGYGKDGTANWSKSLQAMAKDDPTGAGVMTKLLGGPDQVAKFDQQTQMNLKQQQNDLAVDKANDLADAKDFREAAVGRQEAKYAVNPPGFVAPTDPYSMGPDELATNLKSQGVQIPDQAWKDLWKIGHYQMDPNTFSNKLWYKDMHLTKAAALEIVNDRINPYIDPQHQGFDEVQYKPRAQFAQKITNSAGANMGAVLSSAEAASDHLITLSGLSDAMDSAKLGGPLALKPLNDIAVKLGIAVGDTPENTYKAISNAVASEVAKTVANGLKPDEDTVKSYKASLDAGLANHQIQDVLKYYVGLMHPRVDFLNQQSTSVMGHPLTNVGSATTKAFQTYGYATPWAVQTGTGPTNAPGPAGSVGNPQQPALPKGNGGRIPDDILAQYLKAYPDNNALHKALIDGGWK